MTLLRISWLPRQCVVRISKRAKSQAPVAFRRVADRSYQDLQLGRIRQDLEDGTRFKFKGRSRRPEHRKYNLFKSLVDGRLQQILTFLSGPGNDNLLAFGILSQHVLDKEARLFRQKIAEAFELANVEGKIGRTENPLFWNLRNAFIRGDASGLTRELKQAFQSFALRSRLPPAVTAAHQKLADFRFPYEWYPETRMMQRTVHLHVGPTNSGKTYNALKALEASNTGIYAGPLRLLAHEIYSRFQAKNRRCALITGEEQRVPDGDDSYFSSCTVEMTPLNKRVDVAVIDEIQMIADDERGWAWTQAFLGVQAKELHVCGEERSVDLIKALCARIGDKCVVHTYKRLSSLQPMRESLHGDFRNLRKGDAVVAFSRVGLHSLKAGIEKATGRRCAIVYGSLPPETRAQQAALFNDPDNDYDYLAASDAIGMGLNLEIKRVVFETATKHDGMQYRTLHIPEVKQIGGRAGRYRTATQDMKASAGTSPPAGSPAAVKWGTAGFVTTMEDEDLKVIQRSFSTDAEPLKTAGILPPTRIIERFSSYFPPQTPLSFMLLRLKELAKISSKFHFCRSDDMIEVADIIQPYPMSISDRCIFLSAPVTLRDFGQKEVLKAFAKCVSDMSGGHLLDIEEINLEVLDADRDTFPGGSSLYLRHLEALHKSITLYLWLSYRYLGIFESQHLAFHVKGLVEEKINDYLEHLNFVPEARLQHARRARQMAEQRRVKQEKVFHGETPGDDLPQHEGPGNWQEEGHEEPLLEDPEEAQTVTPSSERTSGIISTDSNQDQTQAGAQV